MTEPAQTLVRRYIVVMRHDKGTTPVTTMANAAAAAVSMVLLAERAPLRAVTAVYEWPTCDYCTTLATRYDRNTGDVIPLCWDHAVEHYFTATGARENTGKLGVSRLTPLDPAEWATEDTTEGKRTQ